MADLKHLARLIFHETLAAIDIPAVMQRKLRVAGSLLHCGEIAVDLRAFSKIRVVAVGKTAHAMLSGFRALLPPGGGVEGIASAPPPPGRPLPGIRYFFGGPPIPNAERLGGGPAIPSLL